MNKRRSCSRRMSNRRSSRRSSRGKSGGVKRKIVKTRRMRGGMYALWSRLTGTSGTNDSSTLPPPPTQTEYAALSHGADEHPSVQMCNKVRFIEENGEIGHYTGRAIDIGGTLSREDQTGIMDYGTAGKYVGAFAGNIRDGQGTYFKTYTKNGKKFDTQITGRWLGPRSVGTLIKTTYNSEGKRIKISETVVGDSLDVDSRLLSDTDKGMGFNKTPLQSKPKHAASPRASAASPRAAATPRASPKATPRATPLPTSMVPLLPPPPRRTQTIMRPPTMATGHGL